ncbi:carboxypeptidase-like regulatory domain-containing protein [Pedobacter sp. BS3]|uniref:carboxypeptidase-like regulatory domain-containing protein n=1 Tax=Pedobacter sp. BS3 TaxID=2567937 RepID=UPI001F5B88D2|nr:carboxypeptidase-like regulatory domain-containing protein [Pedobacter sp. BS3]
MRKFFTNLTALLVLSVLVVSLSYGQQNLTVRGTVTDAGTNETLIGVSVRVKDGTTGTSTSPDGTYTITVPGNATLVFSYIGYASQEIAVNNQTTLNVALHTSATSLEQVVVVGYGTQKRKDLTGTIASVQGEEIERFTTTNPVAALQGKVPGMTITNAGSPGSKPTVRLRGISSTKYADPLYVVDGIL